MKDLYDNIIYIGKANVLKNRVSQYFRASANLSPRIANMVTRVKSFEYIVTSSEVEALILESNLIKEHKPRFNVLLKDDKNYPYIKVTTNEDFPRIFITRKMIKDGSRYFGPFADANAVKEIVSLLCRIFQLRLCSKDIVKEVGKGRPCLNYHIKNCIGPCSGNIDIEQYRSLIDGACRFLEGKQQEIIDELNTLMREASENLEYEKAAAIRDKILSANRLVQKQTASISADPEADMDIVGLARGVGDACIQVFFVRRAKLVGRENFMFKGMAGVDDEEIISSFIKQFYSWVAYIPSKMLIGTEIDDTKAIENWLTDKKGAKVEIKVPQKGEKRNLLEIARRNAEIELHRQGIGYESALYQLKELLGIQEAPKRIEAYDISNLAGSAVVGCMVVLEKSAMDKSQYKRFKIKTAERRDDPGCINEVISRRFRRALNYSPDDSEARGFLKFPDLILVDGGITQLNAALNALRELELDVPCAGMVKDNKHRTRGLILMDGSEVDLKKNQQVMKLVSEIQEEVHRFTIDYHKKLRKKQTITSILDEINGIGDVRKRELFRHFGSIDEIKKASVEDLMKVKSMTKKSAETIYDKFHKEAP